MHSVAGFLESAALLVGVAFVFVTTCSRIGVPSIVGYILTGLLIGPAGFGLLAQSTAPTNIGEIGVILLLFALGLALLHKSAERRGSPFPGRTYPTASVTGMPSAV
jgi:CPA2 family monovalent cation:H+ antiporter-2